MAKQEGRSGFLPGEECSVCKGKCCKTKGCSLSPEDIADVIAADMSDEELYEAFLGLLTDADGIYAIDHFVSRGGDLFYLRMKHKCYTFVGVDAMGECLKLGEEGCELSFEKRPRGGRELKSNPGFNCTQRYDELMMEEDWRPYSKVLSEIYRKYEKQFSEDGTFDKCDDDYFAYMKMVREKQLQNLGI